MPTTSRAAPISISCVSSRTKRQDKSRAVPYGRPRLVEHELFNDLVGPDQHGRRNRQPESLGRPYIDGQVKSYGLFYWQVTRLSSSQNLVHEGSGAAPKLGTVRAIGHQASGFRKRGQSEDRREAMFRGYLHDLLRADVDHCILKHHKAVPSSADCQQSIVDVGRLLNLHMLYSDPERLGRLFD